DFFAPSAEVLLSDSFVEHHCMRLVPGQGEAAGLVGLAFEPVRGRNVPDIQGTFWLDAHSAQLRYLEFTYVAPNSRYPTAGARGRVDFATLPNGAWFVRRWFIRMPLTEISSVWGVTSMPQVRTVAFQVDGGEITRVHLPGREPIDVAVRARIDGIVRDGTTGKPLGGATVRLSGTTYRTVANEAGRFRFSEIPPGVYGVEFWHPRLDSLPVAALPSVEIAVTEGDTGPIALALPTRGGRGRPVPVLGHSAGRVRRRVLAPAPRCAPGRRTAVGRDRRHRRRHRADRAGGPPARPNPRRSLPGPGPRRHAQR